MQIVESTLRPPRIALAIGDDASNRVLRRVFRLLGGKWGGIYDVVLLFDGNGSASRFWRDLLVSADPDYVLVVDPHLSVSDVSATVSECGLQPFAVERLKERRERRAPWRALFRELPTRPDSQAAKELILDHDQSEAEWRVIARRGLPGRNTRFKRVRPGSQLDEPAKFPVVLGRLGITGQPKKGPNWFLLGDTDDPYLACRFWSLRAIGRRPVWHRLGAMKTGKLRVPGAEVIVFAPEASASVFENALERWSTKRRTVTASDDDAPQDFPRSRVFLASQTETVAPYDGFWRTSLPSPPALEADYIPAARCVAEFHLLSPNPEDPDGIVLAPTCTSQALVAGDQGHYASRITRRGVARLTQFSKLGLVAIPHISYRQAVEAALTEHRFDVTPSDKGLYQQRSLQLAKGLRYLAWVLRQPESLLLLQVFFEYHLDGSPPPRYRRAVRYDELRDLLLDHTREVRGGSLRGPWKKRAEEWLGYWVDGFLERDLLLGGHVLRCPVCADRSFYRLESLGQSFECRRCMATSPMPGDTPRCFQLNEAIFQLLEHDGEVATLTLAVLRESAELSFLYLPEVVVNRDEVTRELDVAALVDGELVIGEVKSTGNLTKKEIKSSRFVAKNSRARRMLFATTAKRPACEATACEECRAKHGEHHADMAWGPEVRDEIRETRAALAATGCRVESLCWHDLHGAYEDEHGPLERFQR